MQKFKIKEEAIEAADNWNSPIHSIRHVVIIDNEWAIMGHINCEHDCEFCNNPNHIPLVNTRHAITVQKTDIYYKLEPRSDSPEDLYRFCKDWG